MAIKNRSGSISNTSKPNHIRKEILDHEKLCELNFWRISLSNFKVFSLPLIPFGFNNIIFVFIYSIYSLFGYQTWKSDFFLRILKTKNVSKDVFQNVITLQNKVLEFTILIFEPRYFLNFLLRFTVYFDL